MRIFFLFLLLIPYPGSAQTGDTFLRDTSYSVYSTFQKLKKQYPFIIPVKPFPKGDFHTISDRVYRTIGKRELHMDIFHPSQKGKKLYPAILLIHGGGWASGNKSLMVPLAQKLAEKGYVTAAVEYRLSPEAKYPAAIYDLKEAVKFIKSQSPELSVDTSRVISLGCSAGATLATFLGVTSRSAKFETPDSEFPGVSSHIYAIINIDGIVDFTHPAESEKDTDPDKPSAGARWFGSTYTEDPFKWEEASPLNYAGGNTPPVLFLNSDVPRFHAGRGELLEKIKVFDIYNETHTLEDSPHSFWLFAPWFNKTSGIVDNFLKTIIK